MFYIKNLLVHQHHWGVHYILPHVICSSLLGTCHTQSFQFQQEILELQILRKPS